MNARELLTAARTADDVLALLQPEHLADLIVYHDDELAFDLARARKITGASRLVDQLRSTLRSARRSAPQPLREASSGYSLRAWLVGCGCPSEWLPVGDAQIRAPWAIKPGCVSDVSGKNEVVIAAAPIAVVGRMHDPETDRVSLLVAWSYHGRWHRRAVDRSAAVSRDGVLALAAAGAPVDQASASYVAQWLGACDLALDTAALPALSRMGWLPDGTGYAWGGTAIGAPVTVLPPGGGEREELARYRPGGTWEGWVAGVWQRSVGYPAEVVILASLAAPLLHAVGSLGYTLDIGGPRGTGKTTAQHAAESVWGSSLVVPWPRTWAGMRSTVEFRADLPTILDDTKHCGGAWHLVKDLLYQVASERSQVLGSAGGGTRAGRMVRTLVISTGEAPIAEHLQDAQGAAFRILTLGRPPYPPGSNALVVAVEDARREHYGHAGPRLVRWLVEHRAEWDGLRDRWRTLTERLMTRHAGDDAGRLAPRLALLELASELAVSVLGLRPSSHALGAFAEHALGGVVERDVPAEALRWTLSYLASRPTQVVGYVEDRHQTYPLLAQRIDAGPLSILVSELPRILEANGYDPTEIRKQWLERGWLARTEPGRTDCRAIVRGQRARVVEVDPAALAGVVP